MLGTTLFLVLAAPLHPPSAPDDPFARFELPGGARLAVLHVPDAPRQSTFTFLPAGLLSDAAGEAQLSHLVEHALIRSTDPDTLEPEGMHLNGETTSGALRLDTYAEPDHWRASLERHAAWLAGGEVPPEVLEREKPRIAAEERTTVEGGHTHKWAEAAWNQVVVHGRAHAAVHGDVARATADDVRACIERAARLGPEVSLVTVGPVDPGAIHGFLAEALAPLAASTPAGERSGAGAGDPAPSASREPAEREATWDLEALHYLEWIDLPDCGPVDRVAAHVAARLAAIALARDARFGNGRALASIVSAGGVRRLLLSASLEAPDALEAARRAFASAVEDARSGAGMPLAMALFQSKAQAVAMPDPAAARRQLERAGMDASLVEAQLALNLANVERALGLTWTETVEAWTALDEDALEAFLDEVAAAERGSLRLAPAGD